MRIHHILTIPFPIRCSLARGLEFLSERYEMRL
jgi:hypothetical protein